MTPSAANPVRRWRNSPLHREVDADRARWVWKVVAGIALATVPFAIYLVQTMSFVETRYAIEELRKREDHLVEAERRLRIEKAFLEALPSVESRAAHDLGLVRPRASEVVVVTPGDLSRPAPPGRPFAQPVR